MATNYVLMNVPPHTPWVVVGGRLLFFVVFSHRVAVLLLSQLVGSHARGPRAPPLSSPVLFVRLSVGEWRHVGGGGRRERIPAGGRRMRGGSRYGVAEQCPLADDCCPPHGAQPPRAENVCTVQVPHKSATRGGDAPFPHPMTATGAAMCCSRDLAGWSGGVPADAKGAERGGNAPGGVCRHRHRDAARLVGGSR